MQVNKSALEKRIKRHIVGRDQTFFVVVIPGLEDICLKEISSLPVPLHDITPVKGGVTFKARLHDMYFANCHLRTASRVLMRVDTFKASNFRQLAKKVGEIPWELYFYSDAVPLISVSTRHSRLFHKDAIREIVHTQFFQRRSDFLTKETNAFDGQPQQIFVRGEEDLFTISIDTSGELLHKRGFKELPAKAPIRETIAASALLMAGFDASIPLIDPMCGVGTFSIEAAMIKKRIPPGYFRSFSFQDWPAFKEGRMKYIREAADKEILPLKKPSVFASDKDEKTCGYLNAHLEKVGVKDAIRVCHADFFSLYPADLTAEKGVVAMNPPYGIRIGTEKESLEIFDEIVKKLKKDYKGWQFVLVASGKNIGKCLPFKAQSFPFLHGGLKLSFKIGKVL